MNKLDWYEFSTKRFFTTLFYLKGEYFKYLINITNATYYKHFIEILNDFVSPTEIVFFNNW